MEGFGYYVLCFFCILGAIIIASLVALFGGGATLFSIPWDDITTSESKVFFVSYLDFMFAQVPSVTIQLPKKLGDMILLVRADLTETENPIA